MTLDRDTFAAEHVLGMLDGDERREAERLAESDPAFQAAIARWQARFAELDRSAAPVAADEALWRRIEATLPAQATAVRVSDPTPVLVPGPLSAFRALWRSLPFWRVAGLAGAFASLLLAAGLGVTANRAARQPVLIAVLLTDQSHPAAVVNAFANGQAELVPLAGLDIPRGRALEVWAIPGQNQPPVSVGVVTEPRSLRLNLERLGQLRPDQLVAISVEPPTGSPTGQPTGPVILKGSTATAL
jgi:anti-sigma-K factor RskA